MQRTITYISFAIAALLVILVFVTTKTYNQLAIGIILYVPLAYLALEIFPRKNLALTHARKTRVETPKTTKQVLEIADQDKRMFLKLVGVAGISFLLFSLFGKRTNIPFLDRITSTQTAPTDSIAINANSSSQSPTESYKITEIDDGEVSYYGFINQDGAWFIMREDTNNNSFRYTRGGSGFPSNWEKRKTLKYDYYHNLF